MARRPDKTAASQAGEARPGPRVVKITCGFLLVILGVILGYLSSFTGEEQNLLVRVFYDVAGLMLIGNGMKGIRRRTRHLTQGVVFVLVIGSHAHVGFIEGQRESFESSVETAVSTALQNNPLLLETTARRLVFVAFERFPPTANDMGPTVRFLQEAEDRGVALLEKDEMQQYEDLSVQAFYGLPEAEQQEFLDSDDTRLGGIERREPLPLAEATEFVQDTVRPHRHLWLKAFETLQPDEVETLRFLLNKALNRYLDQFESAE